MPSLIFTINIGFFIKGMWGKGSTILIVKTHWERAGSLGIPHPLLKLDLPAVVSVLKDISLRNRAYRKGLLLKKDHSLYTRSLSLNLFVILELNITRPLYD